jgi:hypothetical protein
MTQVVSDHKTGQDQRAAGQKPSIMHVKRADGTVEREEVLDYLHNAKFENIEEINDLDAAQKSYLHFLWPEMAVEVGDHVIVMVIKA